jgi:hypothetical protein
MTTLAVPGDTIRVSAKDVTLLDAAFVEQPVITGLVGTLNIRTWDTDTLTSGPHSLIQSGSTDDWYFDATAPAVGRYRLVVVLSKSGAQRTLYGELRVEADTPT